MIPKIIHYCWFGGKELPALAKKCIASWKKFCPDWQIIEWNESNFDISAHPYAAYCHDRKMWAFLSDFVRLQVVEQQGGVYLDTDVELLRPLDDLCEEEAFYGFEDGSFVATGLGFGAEAGHPTVKAMLAEYLALKQEENGEYIFISCPRYNTAALEKMGLVPNGEEQTVAGARILPRDHLNPYNYITGLMKKTENTRAVHWYGMSWIQPRHRLRSRLTRPFHRIFGADCFRWLKKKEKE